jgi:phosphoglycolate phosphatase
MNLLFDLDGTLTDPYQGITKCISHALEKMGRKSPPQMSLRWCIGPPLKDSLSKLLESEDNDLSEKALSFYRERYSIIGIYENEVYKDIPEALETLNKIGHNLFVATSKPGIYAKRIIDHFELQKYFKNIHGSELDGTRVEKTNLISYILKTESIIPAETIMIGDREHDILGAKENRIRSIGVLWGYGTKDELEKAGANFCISHPRDLFSFVEN